MKRMMWQYVYGHIYNPNMDTNKSKVSVSVCMISNSKAEFVLVSSIVIMHRSILNKNMFILNHLESYLKKK